MLPVILLVASLFPSQQVSAECVDRGATTAATETQAVRGQSGAAAVLKVSTSDDHSKNSHLCNANYQLLITPAAGGSPLAVDILTANDDYGRTFSLHLDGFTRDGKRVLGSFSERSKRTATFLFDYDSSNGNVQLVDLNMQFSGILSPSCSAALDVIGTTNSGDIILEVNSAKACGAARRWAIKSAGGKPHPFPQGAPIQGIYEPKGAAQ
jgi:hypothetical protein